MIYSELLRKDLLLKQTQESQSHSQEIRQKGVATSKTVDFNSLFEFYKILNDDEEDGSTEASKIKLLEEEFSELPCGGDFGTSQSKSPSIEMINDQIQESDKI